MLNIRDQQQIDRVVSLVFEVLDSDAVGAYLFGSAVVGGLRPASDLDVLVVLRRGTTRDEKERLVGGLLATSGRNDPQGKLRRIELTMVVDRDVKPWRYPPKFDFQYGDWLRTQFEGGNLEPWPRNANPDLTILVAMVLLANTPLFGPPPAHIFDPVPTDVLLSTMLVDIDRLRDDIASDTRNVILTLARIWNTVATGDIRSKDTAADWVLNQLPDAHRPVLDRARAIYLDDQPERWDDLMEHVGPHVDYVMGQIRGLAIAASERR